MKSLLLAALVLTTSSLSHASRYYVCEGFAGVEEYRASIDLEAKTAGFFDNDATSELTLTEALVLESHPPQYQYTFEGKEPSYAGTQKLIFNETRLHASMYSIDSLGHASKIGEAACRATESAW